jgi:hypothetical protein
MSALLIGFQYNGDKYLNGIKVDLELMQNYCRRVGLKPTTISDLTNDTPNYSQAIFNYVDIHTNEPLLLYFTGHAKDSCLILPDGTLCMNRLRKHILSRVINNVLVVMDCCNSSGFGLPYELTTNGYKQRDISFDISTTTTNMLCISSSRIDEKAVISSQGSPFTRTLVQLLEQRVLYLPLLLSRLKEACSTYIRQTPTIFSNTKTLVLWLWVFGERRYSLELRDKDIYLTI